MNRSSAKPQDKLSVAFQGELGAYSQKAIYAFFGKIACVMPLPTLQRVFGALSELNDLDSAVVPIENSLGGTVGETVDLLISKDVRIVGETCVPVEHCLITNPCTTIDKIRKVISHPQALAQCREYLDEDGRKNWGQVAVYDTAGSVKMIKEQKLFDSAGIASSLAAEIYGMKIVARGIEDDHSNTTRFIVIERIEKEKRKLSAPTGNDKTSIIFAVKHEPGALVRALGAMSSRGINIGKIESRPYRSRPWEYYFYVDFDGHFEEDKCKKAIADLHSQCEELKVLGSYKRGV
ncbi:MAG: prephenate dehydratase [Nitrososphaerales archaeon]